MEWNLPKRDAPSEDADTRLPDRIADHLIMMIFRGELRPGDRLPPERQLALQMDVDRTSLRMGLLILKRMNLVSVVQGSGIEIRDFYKHAGLDFLSAIYRLQEPATSPSFLLQLLEYVNATFPNLLVLAAQRSTPESLRRLEAIYERMARGGLDLETMAALAVEVQDRLADTVGNIVLTLTLNSTRSLRIRLMRRLFDSVEPGSYAREQMAMLRHLMAGQLNPNDLANAYRLYLTEFNDILRTSLVEAAVQRPLQERLPAET